MARGVAVFSGSSTVHSLCDDGFASFSGSVGVTGSLNPDGDGQFEFGTPTTRWKDVHAVCTTVGAIFETGLTTKGIGKYPTGTVLSWQAGGLVPSSVEEDKMVMGIAKEGKDQPIVFGAEPLLVTGKVKVGDFIVTSNKPGHGRAAKTRKWLFFKRDLLGKIIAQALEPAEGESSLIKCMVLKM
jgi:hypothetical protein